MRETLNAYFSGVNEDRFDDVAALFAPDATLTAPGVGPLQRDEIAAYLAKALSGYPTHHDEPTRTLLAEHAATVEITFTGETTNGTPDHLRRPRRLRLRRRGPDHPPAHLVRLARAAQEAAGVTTRYAALLACAALWGCVFVGVHELLPVLDPVQMVTLRFLGVAAIFGVLLAIHPPWRPRAHAPRVGDHRPRRHARRPGLPARDRRGPALPLAADRLADRDLLARDRGRARRAHASASRASRSPASRSRSAAWR